MIDIEIDRNNIESAIMRLYKLKGFLRCGSEEQGNTGGNVLRAYINGNNRQFSVYFAQNDPRNMMETLNGYSETRERAELMALKHTLEIVPLEQYVRIYGSSEYSPKRLTEYALGWERMNCLTANDEKK
ncbi:uncharacterized protein TRIVIDRAFT_223591 [Trichoderma virens Gv29-8]|uniref:Uncharacterized protein n=1 Tax=Hypocrea virens (strain Gv29-8 / FGSC 10586) TaxID=413071 RepID=G9MXK1_HYPVG|nr:uncharacterized protein TRIVIDRAFT_223591 [Trichoderma virens Gv29-8]EHK20899.1 hypothetical protein TRIVIDRAFT_223591 [Trichoderma virens Gv29-8]